MDYWLLDMMRRLERIEGKANDTHHLLQRLAILATLWAGVATLGYNSQAAQELLTLSIKAALKLP